MSVGGADYARVMAQQLAEARRQMADKRARSQERWEGKRGGDQVPPEPMACPQCREEYGFGNDCPDCGEPLVSASLIEAGPEPPAKRQLWRWALAMFLFFTPYLAWFLYFGYAHTVH